MSERTANVKRAARTAALLVLAAGAAAAQDRPSSENTLDLGTTSITGNRELPKVLYIVPWKTSDLGEIVGRPVNTLLDEVLAPIDPEVFERQLDYYAMLEASSSASAGDVRDGARDAERQED